MSSGFDLVFWSLLFDFGVMVLIWMTQMVVYPGFVYFSEQDLLKWHHKYTTAVSFIVMPLMVGQLGLHVADLMSHFTTLQLIILLLIGICWSITFFNAVPLHQQISRGIGIKSKVTSLIKINWFRTVCWSLVFILSLTQYLLQIR